MQVICFIYGLEEKDIFFEKESYFVKTNLEVVFKKEKSTEVLYLM